jgi:hypothetical protein
MCDYALAGTETGLGIPKPPVSLSCSYDAEKDEVVLRWTNPAGGYELIWINIDWTSFEHELIRRVPGTSTSFIIDRKKIPVDVNDMDLRVIGFRNNIPSNVAVIHVSGHSQEELYGIPYTNGIAPNWTAWSSAAETDRDVFEQAEKYPNMQGGYNAALGLLTKPFYQVIKAPRGGGAHGIYRKFLGLTPGHTYRLTACLTTLDMDSVKGNWSVSLCAAPGAPDGKDLTVQQLAGSAPLPDRRSGLEAGRIASYGPGNTTRGAYELVFSGENGGSPEQTSSNITLPAGVDTITVWVRFRCSDPTGKVGFSGVKLEDISAISNPKSPEQIMQEENEHEMRLMKWIERNLREESP